MIGRLGMGSGEETYIMPRLLLSAALAGYAVLTLRADLGETHAPAGSGMPAFTCVAGRNQCSQHHLGTRIDLVAGTDVAS